jgi:hypothetical protein
MGQQNKQPGNNPQKGGGFSAPGKGSQGSTSGMGHQSGQQGSQGNKGQGESWRPEDEGMSGMKDKGKGQTQKGDTGKKF